KETPKKTAFISADTGWEFDWQTLKDNMDAVAYKLIEMGVKKGDYIASSLPFLPEHIFLMFACFKIGAVFAPLDVRLKAPEVERCLRLINAKLYFHLGQTDFADFAKLAEVVMNNCDFIQYCVQFSNPDQINEGNDVTKVISAFEFAMDAQELFRKVNTGERKGLASKLQEMASQINEREGCLVIYTTGSTSGYPKPALICHQGITVQALCTGFVGGFDNGQEIMCINMPPSHVGGLTQQFMTTIFFGCKAIILDIFKPDLTLDAVSKYKCTFFGQIPAMFNMMWRMPNYTTYNLSSLKIAFWGGASVTRPFVEQICKMAPKIGQGFGMTELSGAGTYSIQSNNPDDILQGSGWFMPISPLTIRAPMNKDGTAGPEKAPGELGEICFSGPQVFLGYVNDPDNTKKTISTDGWLYTGDLGSYDEKGLHISGRSKFMIKPKGYNVYPPEIEDFIEEKFKDRAEIVAALGMPHDVFTEGIVLFVEKKAGKIITPEEVMEACKGLAGYKRPSAVIIMEPAQIPLTRTEKTDYVLLKNIAAKEIEKLRAQGKWDKGKLE
nr:class I adenylate-forming enzyme family protein [Candidatus Sigynarchaeota archaeon]